MIDKNTGELKQVPGWVNSLLSMGWNRKITPNSLIRLMPKKALGRIRKNMKDLSDLFTEEEIEIVSDFQYHMIMRPPSTEKCVLIMFQPGFVCPNPLEPKLGDKEFPIPVSFIYGENDWVTLYEE